MYVYERLAALLALKYSVPSHRIALRARLAEDFLWGNDEIRAYSQQVQVLFPQVSPGGQASVFHSVEESVLAVEAAYDLTLDSALALIRPVLAARLGTYRFNYDTPLGERFNRHDRVAVAYDLQGTFDPRGLIGKTFITVGDLAFYIETRLYQRALTGNAYGTKPPEGPPMQTRPQSL